MALLLALREGDAFYVADVRVTLVEIKGAEHFTLETPDGTMHDVVGDEAAEVLPGVMVSAGYRHEPGQARVLIDAPRSVKILRGELYEELHGGIEKFLGD